ATGPTKIDIDVTVKATPAEVWTAWTTNEGLHTWMSPNTNVECRIGGPFEIYFNAAAPAGERGSDGCKILSYVPGEMLSYDWNAPPQFAHARQNRTWVVILLSAVGEKETKVRLVHLGWDDMQKAHPDHAAEWKQVHEYFTKAWAMKLGHLKQRFATGPMKWDEK
ncbi:MAG: SRPBCC domain-containing protein, partial [Phycisphaerae bacterium]